MGKMGAAGEDGQIRDRVLRAARSMEGVASVTVTRRAASHEPRAVGAGLCL